MTFFTSVDKITEYLYISGIGGAVDSKICELKITCIVDAANISYENIGVSTRKDIDRLKITVDDTEAGKLTPYFDEVADKIAEHKAKNGRTLVHCAAGISRSSTLCMVYFMKHENMSLREAYILVKSKRSLISPNMGFWQQLMDYERKLRGTSTVKWVERVYRNIPDVCLETREY